MKPCYKSNEMLLGGILFLILCIVALAAPLIAPFLPGQVDLSSALQDPDREHLFGTDHLGRDVLSRVLYGARVTIPLSLLIVVLSAVVGFSVGLVSGYAGGIADEVLMRGVDIMLAFPRLIFAMAVAGILGAGIENLIIAMSATGWMYYARVARSSVLSIKNSDFILSLKAAGCSRIRILILHVIPNVISPILVLCTMELGHVILSIAALGFLGLGVPSSLPEWGTILSEARPFIEQKPLLLIIPGAMIAVTVASVNLLGEGLRDILDPRQTETAITS